MRFVFYLFFVCNKQLFIDQKCSDRQHLLVVSGRKFIYLYSQGEGVVFSMLFRNWKAYKYKIFITLLNYITYISDFRTNLTHKLCRTTTAHK